MWQSVEHCLVAWRDKQFVSQRAYFDDKSTVYAPVERRTEKEALARIHTPVPTLSDSVVTVVCDRPNIAWTARVYAQINDQPEVVNKIGWRVGTTVSRAMSGRVKTQVICLQMLNRTKNTKLRKAILEYADADLICALCECAHNILRGTVRRLTPREKVRLRKYKDKLRLIANMWLSISRIHREIQQNGGFLPALLCPLETTVFLTMLRQLFA